MTSECFDQPLLFRLIHLQNMLTLYCMMMYAMSSSFGWEGKGRYGSFR